MKSFIVAAPIKKYLLNKFVIMLLASLPFSDIQAAHYAKNIDFMDISYFSLPEVHKSLSKNSVLIRPESTDKDLLDFIINPEPVFLHENHHSFKENIRWFRTYDEILIVIKVVSDKQIVSRFCFPEDECQFKMEPSSFIDQHETIEKMDFMSEKNSEIALFSIHGINSENQESYEAVGEILIATGTLISRFKKNGQWFYLYRGIDGRIHQITQADYSYFCSAQEDLLGAHIHGVHPEEDYLFQEGCAGILPASDNQHLHDWLEANWFSDSDGFHYYTRKLKQASNGLSKPKLPAHPGSSGADNSHCRSIGYPLLDLLFKPGLEAFKARLLGFKDTDKSTSDTCDTYIGLTRDYQIVSLGSSSQYAFKKKGSASILNIIIFLAKWLTGHLDRDYTNRLTAYLIELSVHHAGLHRIDPTQTFKPALRMFNDFSDYPSHQHTTSSVIDLLTRIDKHAEEVAHNAGRNLPEGLAKYIRESIENLSSKLPAGDVVLSNSQVNQLLETYQCSKCKRLGQDLTVCSSCQNIACRDCFEFNLSQIWVYCPNCQSSLFADRLISINLPMPQVLKNLVHKKTE